MADPAAQSHSVDSAGCTTTLDQPQARCLQATSEDHGTAATALQAGSDSAGCAAAATATTTPERPQPPRTVREFEQALQGLGFTRRQAAHIARDGFKAQAIDAEPDHDSEALHILRDALKRNLAHLNTKVRP